MSTAASVLDSLAAFGTGLQHQMLAKPVSASQHCPALLAVVDTLRKRAADRPKPKPPLDAETVWRSFAASRFDLRSLTTVEIRTLCVSESTALRPELVQCLMKHTGELQRSSCLIGVINAYFLQWRKAPHSSEIEALIKKAFRVYTGKTPMIKALGAEATQIFAQGTADYLASEAVRDKVAPAETLTKRGIPSTSGLGDAVANAAISEWIRQFKVQQPRGEAAAFADTQYALSSLLRPETPREAFYQLAATLIGSEWNDKSDRFRQALIKFCRTHNWLGDPRLPMSAANWAAIGSEAKARFLSWLARDSIVFFFNYVLPDSHETRRRKDFWLRYHRCILDFRVALSDADYDRLRFSSHREQVSYCSRVNHPTTSAFVMCFEGGGTEYVIVEFSEDGNAAHIWTQRAFLRAAGGLRNARFEVAKLKHKPDDDRIIHRDAWEPRAYNKLASLGIRP